MEFILNFFKTPNKNQKESYIKNTIKSKKIKNLKVNKKFKFKFESNVKLFLLLLLFISGL